MKHRSDKFQVPLSFFEDGEIKIDNVNILQRYHKKPSIDATLGSFFDRLSPVKILSQDKITITFDISQGNKQTQIFVMYINSDDIYGDSKAMLYESVYRFTDKVLDISDENSTMLQTFVNNIGDINKIRDIFNEFYIDKKYFIHITNGEKGYYTLKAT